nr:MAG TPA: hypothetical protein [Caudoviricetes sp.]
MSHNVRNKSANMVTGFTGKIHNHSFKKVVCSF